MENKAVCYYCGTIYEEEQGKCPLCGSTLRSAMDEVQRPEPRKRLTEKERKQRRRSKGKFQKPMAKEQNSRTAVLPVIALVLLSLAVLILLYFIGDMIGWWPGLEDRVDRSGNSSTTANLSDQNAAGECRELTVEPKMTNIELSTVGEKTEFTVSVNSDCKKPVSVTLASGGDAIVKIQKPEETTTAGDMTSCVFTLEAIAEGETELTVACGDKQMTYAVVCGATAPVEPTEPTEPEPVPEDFEPVLNYEGDISLSQRGDMVQLQVTNLPEGASVTWRSEDASIAKVNEYGEVTAIGGGQTTVIAQVEDKTVELLIRCNFENYIDAGAHLEAYRDDVTVKPGESFSLYLYDSNGQRISDVTYTVEDPAVCEVTDGYVKALGYGTTTITITYYSLTFECIVRVN